MSADSVHPLTIRQALDDLIAAWKAGDALRACAYFAEDGVYAEAGREPIAGRSAIATHFTRFFRDGPAWRFEVDTAIVESPHAAVVYRFSIRDWTGTWRERSGCAVVTFGDSLIRGWREYQG